MYRATAEQVAGTKVFADGKWLTCIGNKPVRVGERIWTDGRCVYGYYLEAQSPLVITPPKEETVIPLMFEYCDADETTRLYFHTLKKTMLTETTDIQGFYTNNVWFINDKRGNCRLLHDTDDYLIVAAELTADALFTIQDTIPKGTPRIEIKRNGEILTAIDYSTVIEKTITDCPAVPPGWLPDFANFFSHVWYVEPLSGFINNADDWAFVIEVYVIKSVDISFSIPEGTTVTQTQLPEEHHFIRQYFFSSKGEQNIVAEEYSISYPTLPERDFSYRDLSVADSDAIKFPMQDGFYFKRERLIRTQALFPVRRYVLGGFEILWREDSIRLEQRTIFAPSNEVIFSGMFHADAYLTFCKTSSGFLLGVNNGRAVYPKGSGEFIKFDKPTDLPFFEPGLYLLENNEWTTLVADGCFNQRLRPMTNFKNWQTILIASLAD